MPPPKQKPIAPSVACAAARLPSSVTAAFMSASKRSGSAPEISEQLGRDLGLARERAGAALLGEQVERERRAAAGAKRPATLRMWSVSPRFSWMTSTPPRGLAAGAHAAISVPFGPANVIGSRRDRRPVVARRRRGRVRAPCAVAVASAAPAAASAASIVEPPRAPSPSSPSRRIASRRVMIPSTWSSATSSARYRWSSVIRPSPWTTFDPSLRRVPDESRGERCSRQRASSAGISACRNSKNVERSRPAARPAGVSGADGVDAVADRALPAARAAARGGTIASYQLVVVQPVDVAARAGLALAARSG